MFIANITLEYAGRDKLNALSPEDRDEIARRLPILRDNRAEDGTFKPFWGDMLADDSDVQWLTERGLEVTLKRLRGLTGPSSWGGAAQQALATASHVQVHVPNVGLQSYDEVILLEDGCTDMLQSYLTEGWRIVAVCPPNSARRPDYILGRRKPS